MPAIISHTLQISQRGSHISVLTITWSMVAGICVRIPAHKKREFELAMSDLIDSEQTVQGRLSRSISRDMQDEGVFWYTESWEDHSAMELHLASTDFHALLGAMKVLGEIREAQVITSDHVERFEPAL